MPESAPPRRFNSGANSAALHTDRNRAELRQWSRQKGRLHPELRGVSPRLGDKAGRPVWECRRMISRWGITPMLQNQLQKFKLTARLRSFFPVDLRLQCGREFDQREPPKCRSPSDQPTASPRVIQIGPNLVRFASLFRVIGSINLDVCFSIPDRACERSLDTGADDCLGHIRALERPRSDSTVLGLRSVRKLGGGVRRLRD